MGTNVKVCSECGRVVKTNHHVGKFGMKSKKRYVCPCCITKGGGVWQDAKAVAVEVSAKGVLHREGQEEKLQEGEGESR